MTEAKFTSTLRGDIARRVRDAGFKFNDRRTKAIPDFCVVVDGRTTWFESKLKGGEPISAIQFETLRRIGRGWFVVWDSKVNLGHLVRPMSVFGEAEFGDNWTYSNLVELIISICQRADQ